MTAWTFLISRFCMRGSLLLIDGHFWVFEHGKGNSLTQPFNPSTHFSLRTHTHTLSLSQRRQTNPYLLSYFQPNPAKHTNPFPPLCSHLRTKGYVGCLLFGDGLIDGGGWWFGGGFGNGSGYGCCLWLGVYGNFVEIFWFVVCQCCNGGGWWFVGYCGSPVVVMVVTGAIYLFIYFRFCHM